MIYLAWAGPNPNAQNEEITLDKIDWPLFDLSATSHTYITSVNINVHLIEFMSGSVWLNWFARRMSYIFIHTMISVFSETK